MTKELARLDRIGEVEIRDVGPALLSAYLDFFDKSAFRDFPEWQSCYCMETHRPANVSDDDCGSSASRRTTAGREPPDTRKSLV